MSDKLTRKELKQPDAFQQAGMEAEHWLENRQKLAVLIVAALFAIGAVIAISSYVAQRRKNQDMAELGHALAVVSRPVLSSPQEASPADDDPPFKTQKEKDEAISKALEQIRAKSESPVASLPLGDSQYRLGQYDAAIKGFDDYLDHAAKDNPLRALALEGRGYAFEAKGDLEQAFQAFDRLAREYQTDFLSGMGLLHQARILVRQGKKDQAAALLVQIGSASPGTAAARMASDRIALLSAEGVKIPTPPSPAASPDGGVPKS